MYNIYLNYYETLKVEEKFEKTYLIAIIKFLSLSVKHLTFMLYQDGLKYTTKIKVGDHFRC